MEDDMRFHTDTLTEQDFRNALDACKKAGTVHNDVTFAVFEEKGSRKRARAYEISLGAPSGTPTFYALRTLEYLEYVLGDIEGIERVARRSGRRFSRYGATGDLRMGATWHEWGYLLEELFGKDPQMIAGGYDGLESFAYQTGYDSIPWIVTSQPEWAVEGWNGRAMEWC